MYLTFLPLLLIGCQTDPVPTPNEPVPIDPPDPVVLADAPVDEHTLPGSELDPVGWLFDDTAIHHVALTIPMANLALLLDDPYEKVLADVIIDGYPVDSVGVRLRGKLGSFQEVNEKPKWKIDFNFGDSERRFFGLKSLALNNSVADCSYLREKLSYAVYAQAGLKVPRVTWATVTVNGEDYGFYQLIETPDGPFLKRVMANPDGNLYDAKYLWGGGFDIQWLDFDDTATQMVLEEGVDVGNADVIAVANAARDGRQSGEWMLHTDPVVDWDNVQQMIAAELFTEHWDGYAIGQNNYRVWFNPDTGLAEMLPWDLDNSFNVSWWNFYDWTEPEGVLADGCSNSVECMDGQKAQIVDLLSAVEGIDWEADLNTWGDLTYDAAIDDPRGGCWPAEIRSQRRELMVWMRDRPNEIRQEWGL